MLSPVKWLFVVAVSTCPALGQGYYPLAIGDRWDYGYLDFPGEFVHTHSVVITAETTMANGKTYAVMQTLHQGTLGRKEFHRQEGPVVYTFIDTNEVAGMDFRLADGDTVDSWITETDTILTTVAVHEGMRFGRLLRSWTFSTFRVNDPGLFESGWWTVTDSLGYNGSFWSPGESEYLLGAVISGKVYGTITEVKSQEHQTSIDLAPPALEVYPNPFNDAARISFSVPSGALFRLSLYDVVGEEVQPVAEGACPTGQQTLVFQPRGLSSGVYFLRLTAIPLEPGSRSVGQVKRIILLR
jgi:hypothetical protein